MVVDDLLVSNTATFIMLLTLPFRAWRDAILSLLIHSPFTYELTITIFKVLLITSPYRSKR